MPPTIIELDIKEVITQINQKLDTLTKEVSELRTELKVGQTELKAEFKAGQAELKAELKAGQAELKADLAKVNEKISGLEKRMDFQEFLSKGLLITFVSAVFGILAKLFGFIGNP